MSALNGNWKIYTDPTYPVDKKSVLRAKLPADAKLFFRAESVEALIWILQFTGPSLFGNDPLLDGFDPGTGRRVAEFYGPDFRILDGLGHVDSGQYEVKGLRTNEAYEEWLLRLSWRAPRGWKSEMHVLALSSATDKGITWSYDEPDHDAL